MFQGTIHLIRTDTSARPNRHWGRFYAIGLAQRRRNSLPAAAYLASSAIAPFDLNGARGQSQQTSEVGPLFGRRDSRQLLVLRLGSGVSVIGSCFEAS